MKDRAERYIRYTMIVLSGALLLLAILLVANYISLRHAEIIGGRHHAPLPVSSADVIRPWMTFDYVNRLFALPPEYLRAQLQITNAHYPRLTIGNSLSQVENAVRNY